MQSGDDQNWAILKGYTVFEGLDGAGTTTQAKLLASRFNEAEIPARLGCEPTKGETGKIIRRALSGELPCHPGTLAALFVADRYEHIHGADGVLTHLAGGFQVISDRYLFSSLAYQSLGIDFDTVFRMNALFPLPEHLIFIETDPAECEKRMSERSNKEIFETLELQKRVDANYRRVLELFSDTGMKIFRLDGLEKPEELSQKVWSCITECR
jgi:dTMP kinase